MLIQKERIIKLYVNVGKGSKKQTYKSCFNSNLASRPGCDSTVFRLYNSFVSASDVVLLSSDLEPLSSRLLDSLTSFLPDFAVLTSYIPDSL